MNFKFAQQYGVNPWIFGSAGFAEHHSDKHHVSNVSGVCSQFRSCVNATLSVSVCCFEHLEFEHLEFRCVARSFQNQVRFCN